MRKLAFSYTKNQSFNFVINQSINQAINHVFLWVDIDLFTTAIVGGTAAQWIVRWTPDQAIRVRALAGVTALCS